MVLQRRRLSYSGWLFVAPLIVLLVAFILYPVVMNLYYSFTSWKGFGEAKWIGLANYKKMAGDPTFWVSIGNTAVLLLFIPVSTFLTLTVAAMLRQAMRGWTFFRAVLFVPNLLGVVIVGTVFNLLLREDGPVNGFLTLFGAKVPWLTDPMVTLLTTGFIAIVWSPIGFGVIYFLAAMSGIDESLYESAQIDGANWWQTFRAVTVPGVRFSIEFWVVMSFINVFARLFGLIFVFPPRGGPGYGTFTLEYGIYDIGFQKFNPSYSSAWSMVLFVLCAVISVVQIQLMKRSES